MTLVQRLTQKLDEFLKREDNIISNTLAKIESITGISRLHLGIAVIVLFTFYMIFGHFAQLICNLIGFVYPAYSSLVALDSDDAERTQVQQLLRYWVLFAFMSVGDFFSGYIFRIIPLYWLAKLLFLVWCIAPIPYNGTDVIYFKYIQPVFRQVKPLIDGLFATILSPLERQNQE